MSLISHRDALESELKDIPYISGQVIYCRDTAKMYFDSPAEKARVKMANEVQILSTNADREAMLTPNPYNIYIVLENYSMWMSYSGSWHKLNKDSFIIYGITATASPHVVNDSRITADNTAAFVPDLSITDLVTAISVVCADGKATITYTSSYPIIGNLIVS